MKKVIGFTIITTSKKRLVAGIIDGRTIEIEVPIDKTSDECLAALTAAAKSSPPSDKSDLSDPSKK